MTAVSDRLFCIRRVDDWILLDERRDEQGLQYGVWKLYSFDSEIVHERDGRCDGRWGDLEGSALQFGDAQGYAVLVLARRFSVQERWGAARLYGG